MKLILSLFFLLVVCSLGAQGTFQPRQIEDQRQGVVYDKEMTIDFRIAGSRSYEIGLNFGKLQTYYKTRYFHIGIGEIRHAREKRVSDEVPSSQGGVIPRSYIYGKQNQLYAVRGGLGQKRYFTEKARRKGVALGISYEAGPTLGLLKPYYLEVYQESAIFQTNTRPIRYTEQTAENFTSRDDIFGYSGWGVGLSEIRPIPGAHAMLAVHLDWGAFEEYVKAVEAGIMLDLYLKKVPIMVDGAGIDRPEAVENRPFFLNLFVNLQLGKRR